MSFQERFQKLGEKLGAGIDNTFTKIKDPTWKETIWRKATCGAARLEKGVKAAAAPLEQSTEGLSECDKVRLKYKGKYNKLNDRQKKEFADAKARDEAKKAKVSS